jgi:hypothetical protein
MRIKVGVMDSAYDITNEYHGFNADWTNRHPSNRIAQILYLRGWFDKYKRKPAQPATASDQ